MRILFFGFLFMAAIGLVAAVLIGVAIKIVLFIAMAVIGLAVVGWVMGKLKGPKSDLKLDMPVEHD
ncbi:MAG: hypothetical protein ACRED3_16075, partial [Bradyrhizobium sp.]